MTNYHSIQALSNSSLSVLKRSPAEFYARFIASPPTMASEETDAMRLGSAVHMLALEPERFDAKYTIETGPLNQSLKPPKPYGRASDKFKKWLEDAKATETREILLADEFEQSLKIAKAFQSHPTIAAIMASKSEKFFELEQVGDFRWDGAPDWFKFKARLDFVMPDEGLIVDLKTTHEPSMWEWSWTAGSHGYHRQAALYSDIMESRYKKPFKFIFGVVRSKEPFEAHCYEPDEASIIEGRDEYRQLAIEWHNRKANGDWSEDSQKQLTPIRIRTRRKQ